MTGPGLTRQVQEMSANEQEEDEELIAHFQNFNMADLAADDKSVKSVQNKSERSSTRKPSAVKPSPLEEENADLKAIVD